MPLALRPLPQSLVPAPRPGVAQEPESEALDLTFCRPLVEQLSAICGRHVELVAPDSTRWWPRSPLAGVAGQAAFAGVRVLGRLVGVIAVHPTAEGTVAGGSYLAGEIAELVSRSVLREIELDGFSRELTQTYEQVGLLVDLGRAMSEARDETQLCDITLQKVLEVIPSARAWIAIARGEGQQVIAVVGDDLLLGTSLPNDTGISGYVARTGETVVLNPMEPWPVGCALEGGPKEAVLSVPIAPYGAPAHQAPLGVLTLTGMRVRPLYTAGDRAMARAISALLAVGINNARMLTSIRSAAGVRREIELASLIQHGLLPAEAPQIEGLEIVGTCVAAAKIGGDLYDYVVDADGRVTLIVADVAGHSVGAALMMAVARSVLRREAGEGRSPAETLRIANAQMHDDLERAGLFITFFCARYDPRDGRLEWANGGHTLTLLRRSDGSIEGLDADGMPAGMLQDSEYEACETGLAPGDELLLYTDGVTEARGPSRELFGEERLRGIVARGGHGAAALARDVQRAIDQWEDGIPREDDLTLIAVARTAAS